MKTFFVKDLDGWQRVQEELLLFCQRSNMQTKIMEEENLWCIKMKRKGITKSTLTVRMTLLEDSMLVEVGKTAWKGKLATLGILSVPIWNVIYIGGATVGGIVQVKMYRKVAQMVQEHLEKQKIQGL
ncbi:hypothetical protein BMT55_03325 [Listeria newyorkensis]|uniref:Uncharacterized protein n=1 Tax=Listeria newyorkensis TaxID=1497681 RepID=A0ABX4XQD8_9LIST|nr:MULTISPECIES: hypothetical protein [Listeria]KGL41335.1 hypothetical protein EP56_12190 [Listeriaceae bacterium FSL A5-0209]KGL44671.1 hypothetical protein EP58_04120 [Listeria newyorkensis]MBC1233563.1 hypothetical protein [Listeria booriae]MBC1245883.1 hypothetical protein [Listeria booriae]MBC1273366.1 hypothetical protein [Listeria booriae]